MAALHCNANARDVPVAHANGRLCAHLSSSMDLRLIRVIWRLAASSFHRLNAGINIYYKRSNLSTIRWDLWLRGPRSGPFQGRERARSLKNI